ncbi:MAG: hypothetical protein ACM3SW_18115 [Actinomycetota bacterium]
MPSRVAVNSLAYFFYAAGQVGLLAAHDRVRNMAFGKIYRPWLVMPQG